MITLSPSERESLFQDGLIGFAVPITHVKRPVKPWGTYGSPEERRAAKAEQMRQWAKRNADKLRAYNRVYQRERRQRLTAVVG